MGGAFPNGQIPRDRLVRTHSGWNADGYWEHLWPAATLARWRGMVADVLKNEGVLLYVTPGYNVYRPLQSQIDAKIKHGPNAAAPGFSSHGGFYNGRDTMAVDVANWEQIGKDKFYAYARKWGFIPGEFWWEPWHIIDPFPWVMPAGGGATGFAPEPVDEQEEEDTMIGTFTYVRSSDKKTVRVVHGEAFFEEHTDGEIKNEDVAASYGLKDREWPNMPEAYRDTIFRATLAVRTGDVGVHRVP